MSKKICVVFDANPLVRQKTGVGFYTEGVVMALAKIPELELVGHYFKPRGKSPKLPKSENLRFTSSSWLVGLVAKALRKIRIRLPWELLAGGKADVLFFPDFTSWPSLFRKPTILTVHDLTYVDYPEYVRKRNLKHLRRYVKHDATEADLVLTISEFSKLRIVDTLGISPAKILVEPIPPAKKIVPKKFVSLPKQFILFISTIEPRKNLANLLEAYSLLPDDIRNQYALVVAGALGWNSQETLTRIEQLQNENTNIVMLGYVDEATRASLYSKAALVAVPSIYEGFGMPLLEAMGYGVPVAASDLPVFHEVAGDAALYFDPKSVDSIRACLIKALSDPSLSKNLAKRGEAQLKKYSWDKVANDIYKEIERLAG